MATPRRTIACDVGELAHPDAGTIDTLARLALTTRRLGYEIPLQRAFEHPVAVSSQLRAMLLEPVLELAGRGLDRDGQILHGRDRTSAHSRRGRRRTTLGADATPSGSPIPGP